MPEGPRQISMQYAPRPQPGLQPGKLIRTALRAVARVVAPEAAWPGCVPQRPG